MLADDDGRDEAMMGWGSCADNYGHEMVLQRLELL